MKKLILLFLAAFILTGTVFAQDYKKQFIIG